MNFDKTMNFKIEREQNVDSQKVLKDVYDALVEFCVQQSNGAVPIEKINEVVGSAFSVFSKYPRKHLVARELMNYTILDEGRTVDDILYDEARENAVICDNGVILGTFMIKDGSYIKSKALSRARR